MYASSHTHTPRHLAIVMDGNTRWAMQKGVSIEQGHKQGVEALSKVIAHCAKRDVRILTVFAFSSENWHRSSNEVDHLMQLFIDTLEAKLDDLLAQGISFRVIGDRSRLDAALVALIVHAEQVTAGGKYTLVVALNYGGKDDLLQACTSIVNKALQGDISPSFIDESLIEQHLYTVGLPPPDLCIRTSNEYRLSNFMLWQLAYSELYFCKDLWPDFGPKQLDEAFADFAKRKRRYGKSSFAEKASCCTSTLHNTNTY